MNKTEKKREREKQTVGKPLDGDVFAENVKSPVKVVFKIQF